MEELKVGEIIKERYSLVKLLGSGSFGEVWLAHDMYTNRDVALKIYLTLDPAGVEEFQREYSNTIDLSNPYLLTPEHFDVYNRRPFLVMKYCEQGSSSKLSGHISEDQLWKFIQDVSQGLDALHSQADPIVHQDIKPDNILIDSNGRFLITDFGISKKLRATMRRQSQRDVSSGAMPYMAPERFESRPRLETKSDVWSLGASIYELATGELPFSGFGGAMQRNGAEMPDLGSKYSSQLNLLMQRCLAANLQQRPTAKEIVQWAKNRNVSDNINNPKEQSTIKEKNIREEKNYKKNHFSLTYLFGIVLLGLIIAFILWSRDSNGNNDVVSKESQTAIIKDNHSTAISQILNSKYTKIGNYNCHFYKGIFNDENGNFPVMIAFIVKNNNILKAIYKNIIYGGRIPMQCQLFDDQVVLTGKAGSNKFNITLWSEGENSLVGRSLEGSKELTVHLSPTTETFDITKYLDLDYSSYRIGEGKINVPAFLKYKGESDDGGPYFSDDTGKIRLFAGSYAGQDLNNYHYWITNEMGNGNPVYDVKKENWLVQSGYNDNGEVYYTKALLDKRSNPTILYVATLIYPVSERDKMDNLISSIFNSFPNLSK